MDRGRLSYYKQIRVKRSYLLYHGTILYDFPPEAAWAAGSTLWREPEYRVLPGSRRVPDEPARVAGCD